MNCAMHAEIQGEGVCSQCGHALCNECIRKVHASVYCEDCLAASLKMPAPGQEFIGGDNPDAAFWLGLIPGVGAIYNGEYFKAAIHVLIFGILTSLDFFLFSLAFYCYMPFEAYYTAKKRKLAAQGVHVKTPIDRFHEQFEERVGRIKDKEFWGGVVLIVLGVLYLLNSFEVISFARAVRFWPVVLIALGVWLLVRSREKKSI